LIRRSRKSHRTFLIEKCGSVFALLGCQIEDPQNVKVKARRCSGAVHP